MHHRGRVSASVTLLTLSTAVAVGPAITIGSEVEAQELHWARSAGGGSSDRAEGIATDPRGNSYITGEFFGTAIFGAGEEGETVLSSAGGVDVFVAKYAPDGSLLWARSAGGSSTDQGIGIAADPRGNAYVTGNFSGMATFGAGDDNESVLESEGSGDVFVAKYTPDGSLLWATRVGGSSFDRGFEIAAEPRGNAYVTGHFSGTATFGTGGHSGMTLGSAGDEDVLVAKYAPDGTLLWARSAGGSGSEGDEGLGIATDPRGNAYVTGRFSGTAIFGAGEDGETVLTSAGRFGMFVAKYAPDGSLLWARSAGGSGEGAVGNSITTDPRGTIYVTGYFGGSAVTFGAGEEGETVLRSAGVNDVFVVKYASDGNLLWATRAGELGSDQGFGIAVDRGGYPYITGDFRGTAIFGAGEDGETVLRSAGDSDVFVAKYAQDGALLWARSAGGFSTDLSRGIAAGPRGNAYVTGAFEGTATFGAGEDNKTVLEAAGMSRDIFVANYGG